MVRVIVMLMIYELSTNKEMVLRIIILLMGLIAITIESHAKYNQNNITRVVLGGIEGRNCYGMIYVKLEEGWDMYAGSDKFSISANKQMKHYMPKAKSKKYNLGFTTLEQIVYSDEVYIPFVVENGYVGEKIQLRLDYKTCNESLCISHGVNFDVLVDPAKMSTDWLEFIKKEISKNSIDPNSPHRLIGRGIKNTLLFVPNVIKNLD